MCGLASAALDLSGLLFSVGSFGTDFEVEKEGRGVVWGSRNSIMRSGCYILIVAAGCGAVHVQRHT